jgi:hypothetical protein
MSFWQKHLFENLDMDDVKFKHDPIAVALVRREHKTPQPMHIVDSQISCHQRILNGEYINLAKDIRSYYRKKLFMGAMDNKFTRSRFRMDLLNCLQREDIYTLKGSEVGMIAKLPNFYEEDCVRETVRDVCNTAAPEKPIMFVPDAKVTVCYVARTRRRYGTKGTHTYWFRKIMDNRAFCMEIASDNPLINLLDDFMTDGKVFEMQGDWKLHHQDDFYYFKGPCRILV